MLSETSEVCDEYSREIEAVGRVVKGLEREQRKREDEGERIEERVKGVFRRLEGTVMQAVKESIRTVEREVILDLREEDGKEKRQTRSKVSSWSIVRDFAGHTRNWIGQGNRQYP